MKISRTAACLFWFLTMLTSVAVAQSTPQDSSQDQRILTEVRKRFANEHAFDGMSISPSVQRGIVTLSGTVGSQAAKVLATKEIEDIEGIKSVMNNLNVVGGTAHESTTATAGDVEDKKVILPWGTILPVHLSKEISSKTAKPNDVFQGTIAADVNGNGYILVPAGTPVQGIVKEAKAGGVLAGPASLSIEVEEMSLNFPEGAHPLKFATEPLSGLSQGGKAPAGSLVGLLTTKGPEVVARPDQVIPSNIYPANSTSANAAGNDVSAPSL